MVLINRTRLPSAGVNLAKSLSRVRQARGGGIQDESLAELHGRFSEGRRRIPEDGGMDEGMDDLSLAVLDAVVRQFPKTGQVGDTRADQNVKDVSDILNAVAMFLHQQADRFPPDPERDTSRSVSDNLRVASLVVDLISLWLKGDTRTAKSEFINESLAECVLALKESRKIGTKAACAAVLEIAQRVDPEQFSIEPDTLRKNVKARLRSSDLPVDIRSKPTDLEEEFIALHIECIAVALVTAGDALSEVRKRHRGEAE